MKLSKGFIYTSISSLCWAISIVLLRYILQQGENAYNVVFWTALISLPYWAYRFFSKKQEIKKLTKKDYSILIGMAIISSIGVTIVEFLAIKYSPAINYAFLIRTVLLFTFLFAYIFLKEKITKKKFIVAAILLTGAYLLTTNGKLISLTTGDLFTLLEAALIALGNNVFGKMATNRMSSQISASGNILIGFIPKVVLLAFLTTFFIPKMFFWIFILSIIYILLTEFRFMAYKNASATYVTMIFSFTPVLVSFMAIPLLHESMTIVQIVGGIFIIATGVMVEKLKI